MKISTQQKSRQDLIAMLLPQTVKHAAAKVPAYKKRLDLSRVKKFACLEDLQHLPIITKLEMLSEGEDFIDKSLETVVIQHTGGSSGNTLVIHRSKAELDFIHTFYRTINKLHLSDDLSKNKLLYISMFGHFHGEPTPIPTPGRVFNLDFNDTQWDFQSLVSKPSALFGRDIEAIVLIGLESQLRLFTCRLIELNFDFNQSLAVAIFSTGEHITPRLANWYRRLWQVPLVNQWSMTECIGGARPCAQCGYWHFEPFVIAEVVDAMTQKPISEGYGVLVITCLYPFVQKQPFIRYWTGDLVELSPKNCEIATLGFRYAGRLSTCLLDTVADGSQPLLTSARVYYILDDYPDVASCTDFDGQPGISDYTALGQLKFHASRQQDADTGITGIKLRIETRYSAFMYPDHCQDLIQVIRKRILVAHPYLELKLRDRQVTFSIELVPPGSLSRAMIAQIE